MKYYVAKTGAVDWHDTKYDGCTIKKTGNEYRHQAGSGRADIVKRFVEDGKTIRQITEEAAQAGYEPNFTVDSLFKHASGGKPSFSIEPPEGTTMEDIKKIRKERRVPGDLSEKRAAVAAAKAAKAAERESTKAAREAARVERESQRSAKHTAREADKAEKQRLKEEAKAAKAAAKEQAAATETTSAPTKGKKGKQPPADGASGEAEAA